MKTEKIESYMQRLSDIQKMPLNEQEKSIRTLQDELNLAMPLIQNTLWQRIQGVQDYLNRNMMLNACVSAKRSCFWAATAGVAACISILLTLITAFINVLLAACFK